MFMGFFGGGDDDDDSGGSIWVVYLVSLAVYFISQILILALGRYRELAADRGGAHITHPRDLASALTKISNEVHQMPQNKRKQVETMSAFFIVPTSVKEIFSSHPSLERRLEQLERIEQELGGRPQQ
jgi:heat shock protein HtpX